MKLALQIALSVVGLAFLLTAWPMVVFVREDPALSMMMSLYVTLGVFLLLAVRHPERHRSLIAFAAWSSLVHALWMGNQALRGMIMRRELLGCAFFVAVAIALLALRPPANAKMDR